MNPKFSGTTRRAAQLLMRRGVLTDAEIVELSGISRQTIKAWRDQMGEDARLVRIREIWARAIARSTEPSTR